MQQFIMERLIASILTTGTKLSIATLKTSLLHDQNYNASFAKSANNEVKNYSRKSQVSQKSSRVCPTGGIIAASGDHEQLMRMKFCSC